MHEVMIEQFIASFKHLRQVWPKVKLVIRGDSGFCRWKLLSGCERQRVGLYHRAGAHCPPGEIGKTTAGSGRASAGAIRSNNPPFYQV